MFTLESNSARQEREGKLEDKQVALELDSGLRIAVEISGPSTPLLSAVMESKLMTHPLGGL